MDSNSSAALGEFIGTAFLILLGGGVNAGVSLPRSKAANAGWGLIAAGWGLAVLCGIEVAAALGDRDQHLNPAVTIASVLMTGHVERLWIYLPAQFLGGFVGAALVWLFFHSHWRDTDDTATKRGVFCTEPAIRNYANNFFCEALATFVLIVVSTAFTSKRLSPGGTPPSMGPVLIGGLIWSIGMSLGGTTGYAINPARDFSPRLAHALLPIAGKGGSDWAYAWIPVFGPICGAVLGAGFINLTGLS